jgi:hypothetical protein
MGINLTAMMNFTFGIRTVSSLQVVCFAGILT